ncbi:hypothetical protein A2773_02540 [Candidatus Gottesmanbacteria bacterium RIFCSPHIGHO2_01_FULL_39_10]|uniref:PIN domain-containing protein n=1 Tax=Candidatus Gottesmanbacteria bacterium RIFCSPHIGHO2_01_FULL_39_10 TaxID=1798375 RepID=A0A1F5ZQG2_9BACT|nr:MAG: hypothetical protein A2773_02540 [Candidatus Gottesmanbacteria bacterium RIFCSPHIGHO2_01_FULL_39_10]
MKVLIDADVFVALAKSTDSNHQKAKAISKKIKNHMQFVSPLTLPETATVLSHKLSQAEAIKFLIKTRKEQSKEELVEILLTPELIEKADQIFISQKRKNTSWPDCLNMAILKLHHLDAIFSFDKIYAENKFRVIA